MERRWELERFGLYVFPKPTSDPQAAIPGDFYGIQR